MKINKKRKQDKNLPLPLQEYRKYGQTNCQKNWRIYKKGRIKIIKLDKIKCKVSVSMNKKKE